MRGLKTLSPDTKRKALKVGGSVVTSGGTAGVIYFTGIIDSHLLRAVMVLGGYAAPPTIRFLALYLRLIQMDFAVKQHWISEERAQIYRNVLHDRYFEVDAGQTAGKMAADGKKTGTSKRTATIRVPRSRAADSGTPAGNRENPSSVPASPETPHPRAASGEPRLRIG
jgi:hypothetical protein